MRYTTPDGKIVNDRLEDGRITRFNLEDKKKAEKFARRKRSYVYNLYLETRRVGRYHCGYAIPN